MAPCIQFSEVGVDFIIKKEAKHGYYRMIMKIYYSQIL